MEKICETLSKSDFERISKTIYNRCGIKLPETKKIMVEARLRKRLRELNLDNYGSYCNYLFSETGLEKEIFQMVDVITTNKTDFFREPKQFDFLSSTALPELIDRHSLGTNYCIKIWSAGCSTGEEPYTISMVVNEFLKDFTNITYKILATDISLKVLAKAVKGIYEEERIKPVPQVIAKKYILRSRDKSKRLVRITPEIRNTINFRWLNFMESDFGLNEKFDIIFCRNVIIYFDKKTQDNLIEKFFSYLNPGGYLFLGHSESIFSKRLPLKQLAASTYIKLNDN